MWLRFAAAVLALSLALVRTAPPAFADARRTDLERPAPAPAPTPTPGEDEQLYSCKQGKAPVTITLKPDTEVKDLITWVMSFTCKRFALDPRVVSTGKKVTIVAPNTLTPADAYRVFLVALSTINLTVVPKGPVYRIVDAGLAKKETVPILARGLPDDADQVARYVYRPSYAQPETLKQAFGALKSDAGDVQVIGTILLLTDYATHLRDMLSLAKLIDVPGGTDGVYTIPVHHADAAKLAPKLEGFLGVAAGAAPVPPRPPGPRRAESRPCRRRSWSTSARTRSCWRRARRATCASRRWSSGSTSRSRSRAARRSTSTGSAPRSPRSSRRR